MADLIENADSVESRDQGNRASFAGIGASARLPIEDQLAAAYEAWDDHALNSGDLKGIAARYLPNAKLLPPTHGIALGPGGDREVLRRNTRQWHNGS